MWKTLLVSIQQALANSWNNLFHTFLSILGVVIGVAALVGILSLIDGMERYANEQIASTTSLELVILRSQEYQVLDGIRVRNPAFPKLDYDRYLGFIDNLPKGTQSMLRYKRNLILQLPGDTSKTATETHATTIPYEFEAVELAYGRQLNESDILDSNQVVLINYKLANKLAKDQDIARLIDQPITVGKSQYTIVGITAKEDLEGLPEAWMPITTLTTEEWSKINLPIFFRAPNVEEVANLEAHLKEKVASIFPNRQDQLKIITNEFRVDQVAQGFLLFRLIMGLIVGISVVVGGIGIMNVLLISVTERTREIGLRKAMGAKKKDIVFQFLAESITISALGSLLGLLLGILGTLIVVPIIKAFTDAEFGAAFTVNTLLIVSVVAIIIGVVFGTYPAIRAARLDPVEAIRRE